MTSTKNKVKAIGIQYLPTINDVVRLYDALNDFCYDLRAIYRSCDTEDSFRANYPDEYGAWKKADITRKAMYRKLHKVLKHGG